MGSVSLQEAIRQFLEKSRLKDGLNAARIEQVWEQIMGKTVAKYTSKIYIIKRTLYIETAMAPLRHELVYQRPTIVQRVNEAFGEAVIDDVVIK